MDECVLFWRGFAFTLKTRALQLMVVWNQVQALRGPDTQGECSSQGGDTSVVIIPQRKYFLFLFSFCVSTLKSAKHFVCFFIFCLFVFTIASLGYNNKVRKKILIFCTWRSTYQCYLLKYYCLTIELSWQPYWKSVNHKYKGLFLSSQFYSTDLYVYPYTCHTLPSLL